MNLKSLKKEFEKIRNNPDKVMKFEDKVSKFYQKMKSKEALLRMDGKTKKADKILDDSREVLDILLKTRKMMKNEDKKMDILEKIRIFLPETTVTGDVEQNKTAGNVDLIGGECPDGMVYDKKKKMCVEKGVKEEKECPKGQKW